MATENQKTVVINGQHYDPRTGLPVAAPNITKQPTVRRVSGDIKPVKQAVTVKKTPKSVKPAPHARRATATAVHTTTQRSQTLQRRVARKNSSAPQPKLVKKVSAPGAPTPKPVVTPRPAPQASGRSMDIARSGRISKFAPTLKVGASRSPLKRAVGTDKPASKHPLVSRASDRSLEYSYRLKRAVQPLQKALSAPKQQLLTATSKDVKNAAITKALATDTPKAKSPQPVRRGFFARHRRPITIIAICLALLAGGAFVTISNLPILSVSLAASQAGIKAGYPSYTPDGYSLEQPVTFDEGEVVLNFNANGGQGGYSIKQTRSSWDSTAVLDNVVKKAAGDNYTTTQDSGLTIYSYNGNAAWVNRGILYTIDNDSTLSNDQVNSIATSL